MHSSRHDVVRDQRGAIMILGLFMAISLIGSLWFILGIGRAIFIRDTAIEAADHVAFSAAAVHARGMNFIAALNLVLFALTIVYVAMCAIADILIFIGAIGGYTKWGAEGIGLGWLMPSKCRTNLVGGLEDLVTEGAAESVRHIAEQSCKTGHKIAKAAEDFNTKALRPVFEGVTTLEKGIQVGIPIAAEAAALNVSSGYKPYIGVALTGSLLPKISKGQDPGFGLPLKPYKNNYLCMRVFTQLKKFFDQFVPGFAQDAVHFVMNMIQDKVMGESPFDNDGNATGLFGIGGIGCRDNDPWGKEGIRLVAKTEGNGSDDFQVWSMIFNAKDDDAARSEEKVSMSKHKGLIEAAQPARPRIYYSQAEYYFNCKGDWGDEDCYKDADDASRAASFSMQWRARLDRVYAPSFGNKLIGLATELTMSGGSLTNFISDRLSQVKAAQKLEKAISALRKGTDDISFSRTSGGETMDEAMNFSNGEDKPIH